jgi:hypothetical protein
LALPSLALGHLLGALALTTRLTRDPFYRDGVLTMDWGPWMAARWRYSTTIGHCVFMHPQHPERVWQHELVHVRQYTDLCALGLVLSGCLLPWLGWQGALILWATSGAPWLLPNFFTGWVRFGDPYMGAEHERSAYAQTNR